LVAGVVLGWVGLLFAVVVFGQSSRFRCFTTEQRRHTSPTKKELRVTPRIACHEREMLAPSKP
jgi:hypothetical protein